MLDIGLPELLVIALVGLVAIGPERLPLAMKGMGLFIGRLQRKFSTLKSEIEEEIGVDDIRRQLHNEGILEETKHFSEVLEDPALSGTKNNLGSPNRKETPIKPDNV